MAFSGLQAQPVLFSAGGVPPKKQRIFMDFLVTDREEKPGVRNNLDALNPDWAFAGDGLYQASIKVSVRTGFEVVERIREKKG